MWPLIQVRCFRYGRFRQDVKAPFPPKDRSALWRLPNGKKICFVTDGKIVTPEGQKVHTPVLTLIKGSSHKLMCHLTREEVRELKKLAPQIEKLFKEATVRKPEEEKKDASVLARYAIHWDYKDKTPTQGTSDTRFLKG
eukprot:GEMP01113345.1.p1 GENE.GEMP01113345.1~~GEMP01113345.1.p1  ORF type:complete len:139 (+),score=22.97 GEMP01113345.1:55-471(+)